MKSHLTFATFAAALLPLVVVACEASAPDASANANALSATPSATDAGPSAEWPTVGSPGSHVGVHNMNLFGSGHLYLSHIPLYEQPHNLQVVVEVGIKSGVPAEEQKFGTNEFTISPKAFSLSDLANGTLRDITATIYAGNVESGGRPAYRNVAFEVKRVVFRNPLVRTMPHSATLDYIALGTPSEAYLVHLIDKAPSFEQVLAVSLPEGSFLSASDLAAGKHVSIAGSTNDITSRLAKNNAVQAGPVGEAPAATGSTITVTTELACLPGDEFFGSCPVVH